MVRWRWMGNCFPGVDQRLKIQGACLRVMVLTADTFGAARHTLQHFPVRVECVKTGADKARWVRKLGAAHVAAIGNGRNEVAMLKAAAQGIAVIGPEGSAGVLLGAADVVTTNVLDALDLITHSLRIRATLRV